jgi:hypothetical protein
LQVSTVKSDKNGEYNGAEDKKNAKDTGEIGEAIK